jgi:GntR family transcriptional regulator/MocR family aminotransferase
VGKALDRLLKLEFDEGGLPRYEQLAAFIEQAIRAGEMAPGERLPTVRQLAASMNVSATTISSAFELLGSRRFVRAEVGRGTFVSPDWQEVVSQVEPVNPGAGLRAPAYMGSRTPWRRNTLMRASSRLRAAYPNALECSTGRPDPSLLPWEILRRAWADCILDVSAAELQYGGTDPVRPLSEELLKVLREDYVPARPQDLVLGSSAQQFFTLVQEVAGATSERTGLIAALEDPGYPTLMDTMQRCGVQSLGVAVDAFGAVPASLDEALRNGARLALLTPRGHNPTGATWSPERLTDLADVLRAHPDVIVVEDDQVAGITSSRPGTLLSIPELENRVLYVRSFSKSIAPDLRMAVAVARPPLREALVEAKSFADGWSSRLLQRVLMRTLQSDELTEVLDMAREAYRQRRKEACAGLNRLIGTRGEAWFGPDGVNVWVRVGRGVDSKQVQERSAALGVRVADGEPFYLTPGRSDVLRLNAGSVPAADAAKAGKIVGQAILDCDGQRPGPIHV